MKTLMVLFLWLVSFKSYGKTVTYDLKIENKPANISGKSAVDFALMVNGGIPAPTLEFTEGDEAEITVFNGLKNEEVSIHWHGLLLPPLMDGVPYVNTPPINPGQSFKFKFTVRQHGTYWYHSHTMLQEQKGVYGGIVIHPKKPDIKVDRELVLILSDWTDENPDQVMRNLRKDGDYYLYKKNNIRSYLGAIQSSSLGGQLYNEWTRMGGMDLSDVGYDAFLINGKPELEYPDIKAGETVRMRIINAAASSYFFISIGDLPLEAISADGTDIQAIKAKEILLGMAETYDVLIKVPEGKKLEFRATSQDVTGYARAWLGQGEKVFAPTKEKPNLYATMDHGSHQGMDHSSHQDNEKHNHKNHNKHQHTNVINTLTVDEIKARSATAFPGDKRVYDVKLVLGGDMNRYIWHINGKAIHQDRNIDINEGDVVRFTFENNTMMHHPMHLHGHFFRVLNKFGEKSPLKHTVDVPPHGTRVIEFFADEPGQWMLHCHNLYHLKTGMGRVVRYTSYKPQGEMVELDKQDPHLHDHTFYNGMAELATNHGQFHLRLSRTWDTLESRLETREYDDFSHAEGDIFYRRWMNRFFNVVVGGTHYTEYAEQNTRGVVGIGYILPMLVETNLLIDHMGRFRLDLERKFQWSKYIYSDIDVTFRQEAKTEFEVTLMYANSWHWSVGFMATEDTFGFGGQYRF